MRLDQYLVTHMHIKTRSQATDLIRRGLVYRDDIPLTKAGFIVKPEDHIIIKEIMTYVSRGGLKLEDAISSFHLDFSLKTVIDIGASTGGFTDCALKHGASCVYAYDVGSDQLDQVLKDDPRVISYEKTNVLNEILPHADIIMIDVSFTSIKPILYRIKSHEGLVVALIKPQFEVGIKHIQKGIVKDVKLHQKVIDDVSLYSQSLGFDLLGIKQSIIKGKSGNQEYVMILKKKSIEDHNMSRVGEFL